MCGIFGILCTCEKKEGCYDKVVRAGRVLRHRGPDWSGCEIGEGYAIGHERLSIIDVFNGAQPIDYNEIILSVNGEIYNYLELIKEYEEENKYDGQTKSDCEIILHLYSKLKIATKEQPQWMKEKTDVPIVITSEEKQIEEMLNKLSGDFAFILVDKKRNTHLVARDIIGVTPLYYAYNNKWDKGQHEVAFASEMKALSGYDVIKWFPPGTYYDGQLDSETGEPYLKCYYKEQWKFGNVTYTRDYSSLTKEQFDNSLYPVLIKIQDELIEATRKRLMSDVEFGMFLSGGLDSSAIAAIASRLCREKYGDSYKLKTFSIGLKDGNSPDKEAAQRVADWIGSDHYHFEFTVEEAMFHLKQLVYYLESYDVTTIRASMPMYLLSRRVKAMGIKMVLSGEGSDEIFGGYLYFHEAPSEEAFKKETINRVNNLHLSDCLRANKSTMAWGLEARVPFLDKDFLNYVMNLHPRFLMTESKLVDGKKVEFKDNERIMEKWILRMALDKRYSNIDYLPPSILWRQKEQFSDGVGYGWIDKLKEIADNCVLNSQMKISESLYPINSPKTKEAFMYREIFEKIYPTEAMAKTVMVWSPEWSKNKDPSGRAQLIHEESTE